MGAFFTNLQIRNASARAVCAALPKLPHAQAYVSPEKNGWVTVYAAATEDQNEETICTLAEALSKMFKTDVLGFLVHDSDIAMYWLYRCGELLDQFNSAPDYFGESVDEETRARLDHRRLGDHRPLFHFSDTWQLVVNTGTTIVTFLMVFLIQHTQNRDSEAVQIKLDELIRATKTAHILSTIRMIRMTRFTRCRKDHDLFQAEAKSIDSYT